jgi:hypothetical protein
LFPITFADLTTVRTLFRICPPMRQLLILKLLDGLLGWRASGLRRQ